MKKLLGLLAVAPMAIAACGGTTSEGNTDATLVSTTYYLGHGEKNHASYATNFGQNESYNLIEVELYENDGKFTFGIEESVSYFRGTEATTVAGDAAAVANWVWQDADADTYHSTDQFKKDYVAQYEAAGYNTAGYTYETLPMAQALTWSVHSPSWPNADTLGYDVKIAEWASDRNAESVTSADLNAGLGLVDGDEGFFKDPNALRDGTGFINAGEDLRYVYDVVEVEFDKEKDKLTDSDGTEVTFENKDDNYNPSWEKTEKYWESFLNGLFGTKDKIDAVTDAQLMDWASNKTNNNDVYGATFTETGLYAAAAITAAKAYLA